MYLCEARSAEAFVQQIAVGYVLRGYYFFVLGRIPEGKSCRAVDEKLIARYGLDISKWTRCRRRKEGTAAVQYLRYRNLFVLVATAGDHQFFRDEAKVICDIRDRPIECLGYSIGCYRRDGSWHPSVRIGKRKLRQLKRSLRRAALRLDASHLAERIRRLPFAPFAPVTNQFQTLLRTVNRERKRAGLPLVSAQCVRRRRRPVRVFIECNRL